MQSELKTIKRELVETLGIESSEISVRMGSGAMRGSILVQSNVINIWDNQDVISEVLPGFHASSAVLGIA